MTEPTIPELRATLDAATNDTERLHALLALAWSTGANDPQESLALASESCTLAKRLEDQPAIAESVFLIGVSSNKLGNYERARDQFELARSAFEALGHTAG